MAAGVSDSGLVSVSVSAVMCAEGAGGRPSGTLLDADVGRRLCVCYRCASWVGCCWLLGGVIPGSGIRVWDVSRRCRYARRRRSRSALFVACVCAIADCAVARARTHCPILLFAFFDLFVVSLSFISDQPFISGLG